MSSILIPCAAGPAFGPIPEPAGRSAPPAAVAVRFRRSTVTVARGSMFPVAR